MTNENVFDPVEFSEEECVFLIDHLGEPPVVASRAVVYPVNPRAVVPAITRIYEMMELEKHEGIKWVGVEKVRSSLKTFLEQSERWRQDAKRGAPSYPSMYTFDGRGRAIRGGVGSDSGRVKTYFGPDGKRAKFAVELIPTVAYEWTPDWAQPDEKGNEALGLTMNHDLNRVECFCGHTESFKGESRSSITAARARMSKHLRKTNQDVDKHRELYTAEFGS